ncbi:hypothetical protein BDQ17DRAFT_1310236 [Cyathus striatus]|nr:hypothetical protein BDQ17DRAFT_1310236 [Cyathus striatus]
MAVTFPSVRRLKNASEAEVERITQILCAAFHDDPFDKILLGGDMSLDILLNRSGVKAGLIGGQVYIAQVGPEISDIAGVAIWYPPGTKSMSTKEERDNSGWNEFWNAISEEHRTWWTSIYIPAGRRLSEESGLGLDFSRNAWNLRIFSVAPEHQGKGLGRALFKLVDDIAASEGKSIILKTTNDLDIMIYKRLGCDVCNDVEIENKFSEARVTLMVKKHRSL